jgi:hypothetical protein
MRQAVESALRQSYSNVEILIVDDASDDESADVLNSFASESRINKIIRHEKPLGLTACCNSAIQASSGDFVMRLDADDFLVPDAVARMVAALAADEAAAIATCGHYEVDERGTRVGRSLPRGDDASFGHSDSPPHGACMMIRRSFLERIGGYDETIPYQDGLDLWLHLTPQNKVLRIKEPLVCYRQHGRNLSHDPSALLRARTKIFAKHAAKSAAKAVNVLGVIDANSRSNPLRLLGGKPLIDWTVDYAVACDGLDHLVVRSGDAEVIEHVVSKYPGRVDVVEDFGTALDRIIEAQQTHNRYFQAAMVLDVASPFRSDKVMQLAIDAMKVFSADEVIGVERDNSTFFQHDGFALQPRRKGNGSDFEPEIMLRICPGLRLHAIASGSTAHEPVRRSHVLLDQVAAFTIRTPIDWEIAQHLCVSVARAGDHVS